jgi:dTDP-4-dehydrorhamnose 3,5-epimerase
MEPIKDRQTVTPAGEPVGRRIDGLVVRRLKPIEDKRGDITEMYSTTWGIHPEPMVYAYQVTIHPGAIRGWELHRNQDDRIFMAFGSMRWVLYDYRETSPTHKLINTFVVSEINRTLMIVPRGIFHAVQNVGTRQAVFVNFPTTPFNHAEPDKYRLPLGNPEIPFSFDDGPGW